MDFSNLLRKISLFFATAILLSGCVTVNGVPISRYLPEKQEAGWRSISSSELRSLISGNTLIGKSSMYCKNSSTKKECIKIALLDKDSKTILRKKATVIDPENRVIRKTNWGVYPMDMMTYGLHIGVEVIPTDSRSYPFRKLVKIYKDNKRFKMTNPRSGKSIEITILQGHNNNYLKYAKSGNYDKVNSEGYTPVGLAITSKVLTSVGKSISSASSVSPNKINSYICHYDCISDVGLLYETYRNVGTFHIRSNYSLSSAREKANKRCKSALDKHGYKMRYGSVGCDIE